VDHIFFELVILFARIYFPKATERQLRLRAEHDFTQHPMRDPRALRHFIANRGAPVTTIALGPQYPVDHPRYAPATCLVLVHTTDIAAASPLIIQKIRERCFANGSYDADELWLPLTLP
jgi:hypothetical protein